MPNPFPPLETTRLHLRPLAQDDLDFVFRHFSDPQVYQYLFDEEPLTTQEEAQAIIDFYVPQNDKPYNRWVLVRKADGEPIGTCGFHKWQKRYNCAEIGYDLQPSAWGNGYMREAMRAALQHGFDSMRLNRVEALVYPENLASLHLLERLGFQKEGLLRQSTRLGERYYDHWLLALLKQEWDGVVLG